MFCNACGEKDEILHRNQDTGQKGRNDGESNHSRAFQVSQRSGKYNHLRQRQRICLLERDRKGAVLRHVFCRSVLRMAERNKRKLKRTAARVLSKGKKPFEGESCNVKKEPGTYKRQAQESFALPNSARFI